MEAFAKDALLLPQWVQLWINVLGTLPLLIVIVLLFGKQTRRDALVVFILTVGAYGSVLGLHAWLGMVRLLGLGHVIFWTPLLIYLMQRLRNDPPTGMIFRIAMIVLAAVIAVALVFDYYDVLRWTLGERGAVI